MTAGEILNLKDKYSAYIICFILPAGKLYKMKKWFLILFVLIGCVVLFYFLIPSLSPTRYRAASQCTSTAAMRQIIHQDRWNWWPGEKLQKNVYSFENYRFDIRKILLNGFQVTISKGSDSLSGFLQFEAYGKDSTEFVWNPGVLIPAAPLRRITGYFQMQQLNKSATDLVDSMQHYFNEQKNVYGMEIKEERITDTSLISLKNTYDHYPTTTEIYSMLDSLGNYIKEHDGKINNYPMLNVRNTGPAEYEVMAAIPTQWDLPANGRFQLKKMVLGKILVGEVRGGAATVRRGEHEIANFANDYRRVPPAIPFQSLVTNRIEQPDTSKWITKVNFPVF